MDREDFKEENDDIPLSEFHDVELLWPAGGSPESRTTTIHAVPSTDTADMERRPLQGYYNDEEEEQENQRTEQSATGSLPLDPELSQVIEKILTPKSTYESLLTFPRSDQPAVDVTEDLDRFDDSDFDEHRGFGGSTLHTHHPLLPQYLKKKPGRRKSIPPSVSHPARLQEKVFTPEFRALLDAATYPHTLQPVSEQTEPVEGDDIQEPLLPPPVDTSHEEHEQETAFHGSKPSKAKFYFSAESLAHDSPPGSPRGSISHVLDNRRGSSGSHRLHKSVSIQEHPSPERHSLGPTLSRPPSEPNGEVKFSIGTMSDDDEIWQAKERRRRNPSDRSTYGRSFLRRKGQQSEPSRKTNRTRSTPVLEDPSLRRRVGSDVETILKSVPTEIDEAMNLKDKDLDGMWGHRMEAGKVGVRPRMKGVRSIIHPGKGRHLLQRAGTVHAGGPVSLPQKRKIDRTPHEVYVEMEELIQEGDQMEWKEKARWIKYEEDVEMGGKWGKPHAASLSFHSLLELRKCLEKGTVLLDLEGSDIGTITMAVVDNMVLTDQIKASEKWPVTRALLVKHRHMSEQPAAKVKSSPSTINIQQLIASLSFSSRPRTGPGDQRNNSGGSLKDIEALQLHTPLNRSPSQDSSRPLPDSPSMAAFHHPRKFSQIFKRIPRGAEASTVLVGALDFLTEPAVAFVRLARAANLHGFLEVDVPIRFIFVLLCPKGSLDYYEIGRSLSTLMSNKDFHDAAYRADDRRDLLNAMNEFLADSLVLPPGHLDKPSLLPLSDIQKMSKNVQQRRRMSRKEVSPLASPVKRPLMKHRRYSMIPDDTLHRTGRIFGGLINDVKRRFPWYLSDIRDGLNFQCLASIFFIFFANLAPAITFGGILEDKVKLYMGVSEMLIASSLCGMIFALVAAQPLTIIGATGPLLVFEYSLYKFCKSSQIEFMPFRIWIGFWVSVLSAIVTAFDLGVLIRHVTRFTEEVFAVLIAFIFTFESLQRIYWVFHTHPLLTIDGYCLERDKAAALPKNGTYITNISALNPEYLRSYEIPPTVGISNLSSYVSHFDKSKTEFSNEPNTALFCIILIIGTLFIATELRQFRNSKYLGRNARRAIGDFGVPIAICAMVIVDLCVPIHTAKLDIPERNRLTDIRPTASDKRDWFINPFGIKKAIVGWEIVAAIIPAILVFILMYVEVQITCILVNKKERKLKKGSGYHLDLLVVSLMALGCSFFGLPWMCAATVQTISHISSLSVYSRTHAPGEKPKLLAVREQRVTNFCCSLLLGVGVVFGAPALRLIPKAVVFGVFLFLGLSSISGVQFVDRVKLFFRPAKHHYDNSYVRKVRTWKMHAFTGIQLICLVILIVVKQTDAALSFPFVLLLMVPLRRGLSKFYSKEELHELDKEDCDVDKSDSEQEETDQDKGSFEETHMPV